MLTNTRIINQAFNTQAPWAAPTSAPAELSAQARVTLFQLIIVVLVQAFTSLSFIHSARWYFAHDPAAQQFVYQSLLNVLILGDAAHLAMSLYAVEPAMRWQFGSWTALMWATVGADVFLLVSRALWHLGVGRDMITRPKNTKKPKQG
jgi:uncharacterized membrane protein